jgi:peptidoglycan/LPS O-acetylase OafA/YrhL
MDGRTRLAGADFMRAMACLMVLAHHLALRMDFSKMPDALSLPFHLARFGNYGVSVFFVLSGFLLARPFWRALDRGEPMPSLTIYAMRRAARILPGFWLALTVGFLLSITVYNEPATAELIGRYLSGFVLMSQWHWRTFFPVQGDGPLWSIPFETTCYVLLPAAFLLLFADRHRNRPVIVSRICWLGVIALVLAGHWLIVTFLPTDAVGRGWDHGFQGGAKEWMPAYNPIGFFAIFAIGSLAAGLQTMMPPGRRILYDFVAAAALVVGAAEVHRSIGGAWEGYGFLGVPYRFPIFPLAVGAALCTLPQSAVFGRLLDNSISRYVATVSFGVYIWQDIVLTMMTTLFPRSFGAGSADMLGGWAISSLIAVAVIFAIGTLSYRLLERPVMIWARAKEEEAGKPAVA